ncbi:MULTISPECIES: cyclopropane-fatty-acyl-phospholipid synthase family protein [Asticcacaulis]|uniref:SAM-dependent methyltransferase n=1 Tax=Asticcacaulis TaxID=76890 RepID=UPI001AE5C6E4|nr:MULTISPECIES: class I SAM-dependent methyltransferase [Asticcacaulis]MBP2158225.1 SAM-dependent methyltransferase [Asticcacaulis solisilvae]MDR6799270.1 SAM-dependent methyltransferase [Asticcacaulis sp. BE141]
MTGFTGADFWDERYKQEAYLYGAEPNDFLREHAGLFGPGGRVLSLAEGEGRNAVFLAEQNCRVQGVDFSPEGQAKALGLARARGVAIDYVLADLTRYDMGTAAWDGVVSIFCHLSTRDRPPLYAAIRTALKPGGVFLLEGYNAAQLSYCTGGPKDVDYLTSLDMLVEAFEGFEIILARDTVHDIREGLGHTGSGSVTQFIARKLG